MIIEWYGQACLKVTTKPGPNGEVTVIFDPYDPAKVGLKLPKLTGDILAITHDHFDHNFTAGVSGEYFLIKGPGEYEVKQTFIYGIPGWHDNSEGSERGPNTMYVLESEGMLLAHLGDLGQHQLTNEQLEQLEGVDILALPVGGTYTIDAKQAVDIIQQIEPRIVIPIHYHIAGGTSKIDGVDKFVKAMGVREATAIDKYKVSKKDLPTEETKIIILKG